MRRLFIIRKDLHLSVGKMSAMLGHLCEAYWTNLLKASPGYNEYKVHPDDVQMIVTVSGDIWKEYVNGIFTKTICEAKNLNQLKKVEGYITDCGIELKEGIDWGYINDKCLTELTPENEDGTTTIGVWFRPLPDDIAHKISMKYELYEN